VIKIPPVLCVSAFGRIADAAKTVSADFKEKGNQIVLLGSRDSTEMAGSVYCQLKSSMGNNLPRIKPGELMKVFESIYNAISSDRLFACHDISEGGLAAALAEMCFGGGMGANIQIPGSENAVNFLFNETSGCFLAELSAELKPKEIFGDVPHMVIGFTTWENRISVEHSGKALFNLDLDDLKTAWQQPMREVFR
jgi:phosphoribosylformylglycinamidine synthase